MDILEKLVTIAGIIFVGWYAYNLFLRKMTRRYNHHPCKANIGSPLTIIKSNKR